jgi:branched-chain amino acid transport system substrate-binding protein
MVMLLVALCASLVISGCERKPETVTVGFAGVMSGRSAGLGVDGRDGFLLAVKDVNESGGINGQQVAPLLLDTGDESYPVESLVERLKAGGAHAAVGPMRSQVATKILSVLNAAELVMVSPTVSSDALRGLDDYFFRIYFSNQQSALGTAQMMVARGLKRVAVLYNLENRAYTEDYLRNYRAELEKQSGEVVAAVPFTSKDLPNYTKLLDQVMDGKPQAVLILANAIDTAMFCQQVGKVNDGLELYATPWSFSHDLISYGGKAVEGLVMQLSVDPQSKQPRYLEFRNRFVQQYGREPRFSAIFAYDSARVLFAAMKKGDGQGAALRQALLGLGEFKGLQHEFEFDRYGDVVVPRLYPVKVADGKFVSADL